MPTESVGIQATPMGIWGPTPPGTVELILEKVV